MGVGFSAFLGGSWGWMDVRWQSWAQLLIQPLGLWPTLLLEDMNVVSFSASSWKIKFQKEEGFFFRDSGLWINVNQIQQQGKWKYRFFCFYIYLLRVCLCKCIMAGTCVEARGQPVRVGSLLPPCNPEYQIQVAELSSKSPLPAEHFAKLEYRFWYMISFSTAKQNKTIKTLKIQATLTVTTYWTYVIFI